MLRFLYSTDLHGNIKKYEDVLLCAVKNEINLIHLGGDFLPHGGIIPQKKVINYLKKFFSRCNDQKIKVLMFFGNDDTYSLKKDFLKIHELLDETPYIENGYTFKAYPFVPDLPFRLKTACKLDYEGDKIQYVEDPVDMTGKRKNILDLKKYFAAKTTIEQDLKEITADDHTIMAFHAPPASLNLDVCGRYIPYVTDDGFISKKLVKEYVGSKSVLKWIKDYQPLLVLCGHIHESYLISGIWKKSLTNSLIIQPGQLKEKTTIVCIEIDKKVSAKLIQP